MGWSEIRDADGKVVGSVHICDRGRRQKRCSTPECRNLAEKLCDAPVTRKGAGGTTSQGTCDAALCSRCSRPGAKPGTDLCRAHALRAPLPDHVVNEADDCVSWCPGCRARTFAGLPLDAPSAPKAPEAARPRATEAIAVPANVRSPEDERALAALLKAGISRADALEMLGVG